MKLIGIVLFILTLFGGNTQSFSPAPAKPLAPVPFNQTSSIMPPVIAREAETLVPAPAIESFAKCLTEKGAVFYGSSTCGHCQTQKALFGDAMEFINYVECNPRAENSNSGKCVEANIEAYPTWIIGGQKVMGMHRLEQLAEKTHCEI